MPCDDVAITVYISQNMWRNLTEICDFLTLFVQNWQYTNIDMLPRHVKLSKRLWLVYFAVLTSLWNIHIHKKPNTDRPNESRLLPLPFKSMNEHKKDKTSINSSLSNWFINEALTGLLWSSGLLQLNIWTTGWCRQMWPWRQRTGCIIRPDYISRTTWEQHNGAFWKQVLTTTYKLQPRENLHKTQKPTLINQSGSTLINQSGSS